MTEYNFTHKRPYKNVSDSELHRIKNDTGIRQEHRSFAEAEISYRLRFWPRIVAIATVITAIIGLITFLKMVAPKIVVFPATTNIIPVTSPRADDGNKTTNQTKLVQPESNISHKIPPEKDLKQNHTTTSIHRSGDTAAAR
jgi:hypothetical protein